MKRDLISLKNDRLALPLLASIGAALALAQSTPSYQWEGRKPRVEQGKVSDWESAPEFIQWVNAEKDGGEKTLRVRLSGPFADGAWCQHAGAVLHLSKPVPVGVPFHVMFQARSVEGSRHLTVYRSWGGSKPWKSIELSESWQDFDVRRVAAQDQTEMITFSLIPRSGRLMPYAAGVFEMKNIRVELEQAK